MPDEETTSSDWEELRVWLQATQDRSSNKLSYSPHSDSLLARDEQGMPEGSSVPAVVRSLLDSAVDDLTSTFDLAAGLGRLHPAGIPTLVRGSIELSCMGMWIMTGLGRSGRQERALRVAHDSLFNAGKYFSHLAENTRVPANVREDAQKAAEDLKAQVETLLSSAAFLGLKKSAVKAPLNRTDALKQMDKQRGTDFFSQWQLCSGFAHGFAWAPQLFNGFAYRHVMEGGGVITGRVLDEEKAFVLLRWGRQAISELLLSFNNGLVPAPSGERITLMVSPRMEEIPSFPSRP